MFSTLIKPHQISVAIVKRPVDDFDQSVHRDFDGVINKCSFRDYHIMDAQMTSDE